MSGLTNYTTTFGGTTGSCDLSLIFQPYSSSGTAGAVTNILVNGKDLNAIFARYITGMTKVNNTGIISKTGADLNTIFAPINYVPFTLTNGSYSYVNNIYTIWFTDTSQTGSITFNCDISGTLIVVSGGGTGSTMTIGGGGGGGASELYYNSSYNFNNASSYTCNIGVGGTTSTDLYETITHTTATKSNFYVNNSNLITNPAYGGNSTGTSGGNGNVSASANDGGSGGSANSNGSNGTYGGSDNLYYWGGGGGGGGGDSGGGGGGIALDINNTNLNSGGIYSVTAGGAGGGYGLISGGAGGNYGGGKGSSPGAIPGSGNYGAGGGGGYTEPSIHVQTGGDGGQGICVIQFQWPQ